MAEETPRPTERTVRSRFTHQQKGTRTMCSNQTREEVIGADQPRAYGEIKLENPKGAKLRNNCQRRGVSSGQGKNTSKTTKLEEMSKRKKKAR